MQVKINHAIRVLLLADFYLNAGLSFFGPIYAIFITGQIHGGTIATVGFATAVSQIVKCLLEVPIARYLDKNHGEYDDYYSLVIGNLLIASVPFFYLFASQVSHIYIIQIVFGAGLAFAVPPWYALFSRHLDKNEASFEWSLVSIEVGIASAGAGALGGVLAERFGFNFVFLIAGVVALLGAWTQTKVYRYLRAKVPQGVVLPRT